MTRSLLIGFFAILFCVLVNAQTDKTIAPVYPGAMKENFSTSSGSAVFYSKDGHEKVVAFYEQVYGKAKPLNEASFFVKVDQGLEEPLIAENEKGVTIKTKPVKYNYYVSQALAQLQSAYLARFSGTSNSDKMKHRNDPELQNKIKQYEYLKECFFLNTPDGNTGYQGIEAVLYQRFFASAEDKRANRMNDLMGQYTQKIAEGNIEEASKISEQMNSLSRAQVETTDNWQTAINYLEELEKLAYTTMISIDLGQ